MQEVVSAMGLALNTALRRSLSGDTQPFAVTAKVSFIPRDGNSDVVVTRVNVDPAAIEPCKDVAKTLMQKPREIKIEEEQK